MHVSQADQRESAAFYHPASWKCLASLYGAQQVQVLTEPFDLFWLLSPCLWQAGCVP